MVSFRKTLAAVALAAAAVMAGSGVASAHGYSEQEEMKQSAQCNDFTTQYGVVNVNQGPVCIDFDGSFFNGGEEDKSGGDMSFACNADVTQVGVVNVNQGPVCISF